LHMSNIRNFFRFYIGKDFIRYFHILCSVLIFFNWVSSFRSWFPFICCTAFPATIVGSATSEFHFLDFSLASLVRAAAWGCSRSFLPIPVGLGLELWVGLWIQD
jgi:hypothetical protein